jgi:hypothetical protein
MMNERDKVLDKIKKCMALSASSNEYEAEAALRQARKLMEMHGVTERDVRAAEAEEQRAQAGAKRRPANWETMLAWKIGDAFGCRVVFSSNFHQFGEWAFVGCGASPEVARYAFTVLYRQAKRAREEHIRTRLKRCRSGVKTRRADLFSEGWVRAVVRAITAFAGTAQQTAAIDAYMATRYRNLTELASRDRNAGRSLSEREYKDYDAGQSSGAQAQLNRGVETVGQPLALE